MSRIWKKSCDIESQSHAELDEQMKKLERTLKYYIQSRQSEQHAKTKLTGVSSQKQDQKIERRLSKVCTLYVISRMKLNKIEVIYYTKYDLSKIDVIHYTNYNLTLIARYAKNCGSALNHR